MSMTSLPPLGAGEIPGPMIGLFLIALGTGGIKPCVSAFGGDQFTSDQSKLLQSFFSVFYFAINAGSLLSMLITPVLRGMCTSVGYILYDENLNIPKHNSCPRMLADFIVTCVYLNKKNGCLEVIGKYIENMLSLGLNFYFGSKFLNCLKIQK